MKENKGLEGSGKEAWVSGKKKGNGRGNRLHPAGRSGWIQKTLLQSFILFNNLSYG